MKSVARIKRRTSAIMAALMLVLGTLGVFGAVDAIAGTIKIFKSKDGKVVLICHYNDAGKLQYCDVATPKT